MLDKAVEKFREFHLKEPGKIVPLRIEIPRFVCPIGYAAQISYRSNKWHKDNKWIDYIHWWENPTLICVPEDSVNEYENILDNDQKFDLGTSRKEVTFLGYAIDFNLTPEDRTNIVINPGKIRHLNPETPEEKERLKCSELFEFPVDRNVSYVVCSPNGRIVYIIDESNDELFAFMNSNCIVTKHGIEG